MYSGIMRLPMVSMYGTGLAGSLTNSSKRSDLAVLAAGDHVKRPRDRKNKECLAACRGGQASCVRHWLVPVSKTHALGVLNAPLPFKWKSKNGSSIFSR